MNKKKLYLRQNDLGSKTCYYFPAYLGVVHFQTIYFAQSDLLEPEKNFYRVSWLSNYDTHRQNTIYMPFFLDILYNFQLVFYTKMWLRAIVHNDVTSPYHRKYSVVSGKFKIYTFLTLINKLFNIVHWKIAIFS